MLQLLLAALLVAPGYPRPATGGVNAGGTYDFTHATTTYAVPAELRELSGQTWSSAQQLACIEDETGSLFFYNLRTQRLDSTVQFAGPGDYEDVARLPGGWLILRSDGRLFKRVGRVTTTYDTGLSAANEPEGLTYDPASQTLLVACKGEPGAGLPATQRAVYRLNPRTYRIDTTPAYVLDIPAILARSPATVRPGETARKAGSLSRFAPSAVAVHPPRVGAFGPRQRPGGAECAGPARGRVHPGPGAVSAARRPGVCVQRRPVRVERSRQQARPGPLVSLR